MARPRIYSQDYRRQCFDAWYLGGRPNTPAKIRDIIPANEYGVKPSTVEIKKWMIEGMWDNWADDLDARAMTLADMSLVQEKAQRLKAHQQAAQKLQVKALEQILADGFDSSSAAVQAYFRATEEERKTLGFADLLEKLDKMTNNQVEQEIIALINRASENDQIIDADTDIPQLESDTEE